MRIRIPLLLLGIFLASIACNPARYVRPLAKDQVAVTGTFGGPLIGFAGAVIPVPFTSLGAGYGVTDKFTAYGNFHTTALAFGVIQADLGATYGILSPEKFKPGLSISPAFNFGADTWEGNAKLWPSLDANVYWDYKTPRQKSGRWSAYEVKTGQQMENYVYAGVANWFEFAGTRAHGEKNTTNWIPSLQLGHVMTRGPWSITAEAKWLAPTLSRAEVVVDYKGIGMAGAAGIYLGISRYFGGKPLPRYPATEGGEE